MSQGSIAALELAAGAGAKGVLAKAFNVLDKGGELQDRAGLVSDLVQNGVSRELALQAAAELLGLPRGARSADDLVDDAKSQAARGRRQAAAHADDYSDTFRNNQLPVVNGGGCFTADTPVLTPDGRRPIADLRPGDRVMAYDHATGQWSPRRVE